MRTYCFFAGFVLALSPLVGPAANAQPVPASPEAAGEAPKEALGAAQAPGLAQYQREALAQNLALAGKELEKQRRAAEVRVVRSAYYPTVDLSARYTHFFFGGLDLGALFNPVYGTLNQVTGQAGFPTDLQLRLPPALDAKVELAQPLYIPALSTAQKLAGLSQQASQVEFDLVRREIIAGLRTAYLGHARAAQVAALLRETRALLEENLRVSQQLVAADKQTGDVVFRARAELAAHDQLLRQVEEAQRAAARAVNSLRGVSLDSPVEAPPRLSVPAALPVALAASLRDAISARTELRLLGVGRSVVSAERELIKTGSLPTVALALSYGVQASDITPTFSDDFATVSLLASWNLYNGGKDARRGRVKELELSALDVRRRQLLDQIAVEVHDAHGAAEVSLHAVASAQERVRSAQAVYDIVSKKYAVGAVPQIEVIAARTALLQARTDQITAATDTHLRLVELERVTETQGSLR